MAHLFLTPMHRFSESIELIFGVDAGFPIFVNTMRHLEYFCCLMDMFCTIDLTITTVNYFITSSFNIVMFECVLFQT